MPLKAQPILLPKVKQASEAELEIRVGGKNKKNIIQNEIIMLREELAKEQKSKLQKYNIGIEASSNVKIKKAQKGEESDSETEIKQLAGLEALKWEDSEEKLKEIIHFGEEKVSIENISPIRGDVIESEKESQDPDNKIEQEKGNTNLLEEQSGTNTNTYLNQEEQKSPEIENVVSDFHDNMPSDKISKGDNYFTESPARFTGNNSKSPVQTEKEMKEIIEDNHILEENLKNEDKELELKKEVSARKIQKCFRKKKAKMFKKGKKHGKLLKALYKSKEHTQFVFSINGDISSKTIVLKFYDIQTKKVHEKHEINLDNEVLDKTIISES